MVYTARDLARQLPSHWQEDVKHGSTQLLSEWYDAVSRRDDGRWEWRWFWLTEELPDVLARWGGSLPPEHVHVITVLPLRAGPDVLWLRFCSVVGIDPATVDLEAVQHTNTSLGIAEVELLRRVNVSLDGALAQRDYEHTVKGVFAHETLALHPHGRRVVAPPGSGDATATTARAWVDDLQTRGVDVVGDTAELVPAPAPDEADTPAGTRGGRRRRLVDRPAAAAAARRTCRPPRGGRRATGRQRPPAARAGRPARPDAAHRPAPVGEAAGPGCAECWADSAAADPPPRLLLTLLPRGAALSPQVAASGRCVRRVAGRVAATSRGRGRPVGRGRGPEAAEVDRHALVVGAAGRQPVGLLLDLGRGAAGEPDPHHRGVDVVDPPHRHRTGLVGAVGDADHRVHVRVAALVLTATPARPRRTRECGRRRAPPS